MENTYHLDTPMPVLSETELILHVEKGRSYSGKLEIFNKGEGLFTGIIESVCNIITLKDSIIKGNHCVIEYNVNNSLCSTNEINEDTIIITYKGGELLVPVKITLFEKEVIQLNKKYRPRTSDKKVSIELDQKSYHCDDRGVLTIINPFSEKLEITLKPIDEYVVFNEKQFQVMNSKQVDISFKITKLDKILGKVPLKTTPEIALKFNVQIKQGTKINEVHMCTYITDLDKLPSKRKITSSKDYKNKTIEIYRQYCDTVWQGNKNKSSDDLLDKLKALINYDKTNIDLRLAYCILTIEYNKKELTMKEINNIDRYLLYYDKEHLEVSDILLLLLEIIKGESIQELVGNWKMNNRKSWLKILLKNKYLPHNVKGYEDYRAIYHFGEKNRLLFSEAVVLMNSNPQIPFEEDAFYKALLNWAIAKNAVGPKWLKKIENSQPLLIQYNNINEHIATKLYLIDDNKNMLILICSFYIKMNRMDDDALIIYNRALFEKCRIIGLEEKYIQASYYNNQMLKLEYFKLSFNVQLLDKKYKMFFYLNLITQKERYKNLYYYHYKETESMEAVCFKDNLMPDNHIEKTIYIKYLIDHNQLDCIISLFEARKVEDISEQLMEEMILIVERAHPNYAIHMAREAYNNYNFQPRVLEILSRGFKGTISELLEFNKVLTINDIFSKDIVEEILFKSILTRKCFDEVMDVYAKYYSIEDNQIIHQWMRHHIVAQILIEENKISGHIIKLLEDIVESQVDFGMYLALLKVYMKGAPKREELTLRIIKELTNAGIYFSWYIQLVPENFLGERHRIQQYFEYNSNTSKKVIFNYRLDDDQQFKSVEMKHVALGLYVANIIMFYNEEIQYYIEDIDTENMVDIKSSGLFVKKDIIEQQKLESLFDLINTIEISKELKDITSLHRTVEHYINISSKEIEKITIL
ncbi:MAG: hypothetical protein CVV02_01875 [Firmicutes bacterium HGW-Firmicutes-7]|nr:MAG: hypothetical protein CVV02_01875 [Firmicutes bacterium HGW-Firmicutes-7]